MKWAVPMISFYLSLKENKKHKTENLKSWNNFINQVKIMGFGSRRGTQDTAVDVIPLIRVSQEHAWPVSSVGKSLWSLAGPGSASQAPRTGIYLGLGVRECVIDYEQAR